MSKSYFGLGLEQNVGMSKPLCLLLLITVIGCQQKTDSESPAASKSAKPANLSTIESFHDQQVSLKGWILAEGKSFKATRATDEYYFLLVPEPKLDWGEMARLAQSIEDLKKDVSEGTEPKAPAGLVQKYTDLESKLTDWSEKLKKEEESAKCWVRLRRDVIGSDYGSVDGPLVLVSPTKQELEEAIVALQNRLKRMRASCEIEITGIVFATSSWPKEGQELDPMTMGSIRKVSSLIEAESIKVTKRAADVMPVGGPAGTPGGGGPLQDPEENS